MNWIIIVIVLLLVTWYMTKDSYMEYRDMQGKVMDNGIKKYNNLIFGGAGGMEKMTPCEGSAEICALRQ